MLDETQPFGETELDSAIIEALKSSKLPPRRADRHWGGRSAGAHCSICGNFIDGDTLEYELEFDGDEPGAGEHHVHLPCYTAWERLVLAGNPALVQHERKTNVRGEPQRLSRVPEPGNIAARESKPSHDERCE